MAQEKPRATRSRTKKDQAPAAESMATPKTRVRRKPKAAPEPPMEVATLAYLYWEQGEPGGALEHWLRAERELAA
jgi:hypothetical protein